MEKKQEFISRQERIGILALAGCFFVLGVLWIIFAMQIDARVDFGVLNLASLPIAAGAFLSIISTILFVSYWRLPSRPGRELGEDPYLVPGSWKRLVAAVVLIFLYIFSLEEVHYLLTTFLVTVALLAISGEPLKPRLLITSAVISVFLFIIFVYLLGVYLPGGQLFR